MFDKMVFDPSLDVEIAKSLRTFVFAMMKSGKRVIKVLSCFRLFSIYSVHFLNCVHWPHFENSSKGPPFHVTITVNNWALSSFMMV